MCASTSKLPVMVSLDLKDLERGIGADLYRRPIMTALVNGFLLRFYYNTILEWPDLVEDPDKQEQDDLEKGQFIDLNPPEYGTYDAEQLALSQARQTFMEHSVASFLYVVTHVLTLIGLAETVFWFAWAIIFKMIGLPRIYAFEKLLLDVRVTLVPQTLRFIRRNVRLVSRPETRLPHLVAARRGLPFLPITIITPAQTLTRETATLLRLLRYMNRATISYWTDDALVLVGRNDDLVHALCSLHERPVDIDLGWHKDVIERTTYRLSVTFTREAAGVNEHMLPPSPISAVGARVVVVQLHVESSSQNLDLLLHSMDQFGAICEVPERGKRQFNGKRVAIYAIGIAVALLLIIYYEEEQLTRPSVDVLTLAIGAYTLWMTIGKSAALGETEEDTELDVVNRDNILMAFHGLAKVGKKVINTCWVPEVYRQERELEESSDSEDEDEDETEDVELIDGSINLLEAAIYLNIYSHYGHLIRWKGARLNLDRYRIREQPGDKQGIGHIVAVDRVSNLSLLRYRGESTTLQRLGGDGRHGCRHSKCR